MMQETNTRTGEKQIASRKETGKPVWESVPVHKDCCLILLSAQSDAKVGPSHRVSN